MGNSIKFSRSLVQDEDWKTSEIYKQTERLKRTLDLVDYGQDGTVSICQTAKDQILKEFQILINSFQTHQAEAFIDGSVILRSLQEIINYVSSLTTSPTLVKESKQKGKIQESKKPAGVQQYTDQTKVKETAIGQTQTKLDTSVGDAQKLVPVETQQLATTLEVVSKLPETLWTLQKWMKSIEKTVDKTKEDSRILTSQLLDFINKELKLNTIQVRSDNSIELFRSTMDTILQHSQEYLKFHEEHDTYNHPRQVDTALLIQQSTSKRPNNDLQINQKLEQSDEPTKSIFTEPKRPLISVQALDPLPSGATKNFIEALQEKLESRGIKLDMTDVKSFNDDENGSNLVMVICNNHSRLQANVANAFVDLQKNRLHRILLAVVHCKKMRLLPSTSSKTELKEDKEFSVIAEVVDFAFDKDDMTGAIYDCEFNRRAFEVIIGLVKNGQLVSNLSKATGSSHKKLKTTE